MFHLRFEFDSWLESFFPPAPSPRLVIRKNMETQYLSTDEELNEDSIVVRGLDPDYTYYFRVVAVDGVHETPSEPRAVYTYSSLPSSDDYSSSQGVASSMWFIFMMVAVLALIIVFVAVCFVKMNRGGKYPVQEKEERQGRRDPYDEGGFPEYTQP